MRFLCPGGLSISPSVDRMHSLRCRTIRCRFRRVCIHDMCRLLSRYVLGSRGFIVHELRCGDSRLERFIAALRCVLHRSIFPGLWLWHLFGMPDR
jgi:hypothetical protein